MAREYKSIPCPTCGGASRVEYARENAGGTFRKKRCAAADCGRAFTTLEAVIGTGGRLGMAIPVTALIELAESLGIAIDVES